MAVGARRDGWLRPDGTILQHGLLEPGFQGAGEQERRRKRTFWHCQRPVEAAFHPESNYPSTDSLPPYITLETRNKPQPIRHLHKRALTRNHPQATAIIISLLIGPVNTGDPIRHDHTPRARHSSTNRIIVLDSTDIHRRSIQRTRLRVLGEVKSV